jgi:hypothetical protein
MEGLAHFSPEIPERLNDSIERLTGFLLVESEFLSATSTLELRATVYPSVRLPAFIAAIRAANDFNLAVIERAVMHCSCRLQEKALRYLRRASSFRGNVSSFLENMFQL